MDLLTLQILRNHDARLAESLRKLGIEESYYWLRLGSKTERFQSLEAMVARLGEEVPAPWKVWRSNPEYNVIRSTEFEGGRPIAVYKTEDKRGEEMEPLSDDELRFLVAYRVESVDEDLLPKRKEVVEPHDWIEKGFETLDNIAKRSNYRYFIPRLIKGPYSGSKVLTVDFLPEGETLVIDSPADLASFVASKGWLPSYSKKEAETGGIIYKTQDGKYGRLLKRGGGNLVLGHEDGTTETYAIADLQQIDNPEAVSSLRGSKVLTAARDHWAADDFRAKLRRRLKGEAGAAAGMGGYVVGTARLPKKRKDDEEEVEVSSGMDAMPVAEKVAKALGAAGAAVHYGEWRWSDKNDSAVIRLFTPEGNPIRILVSIFGDGGMAYRPFQGGKPMGSDEHGTSEMDAIDNMVQSTYDDSSDKAVREMVADIKKDFEWIDKHFEQPEEPEEVMQSGNYEDEENQRIDPISGGFESKELSVPEQHQLRIARKTLTMHKAAAGVMGGPSHDEAHEIIRKLTGREEKCPHEDCPHFSGKKEAFGVTGTSDKGGVQQLKPKQQGKGEPCFTCGTPIIGSSCHACGAKV